MADSFRKRQALPPIPSEASTVLRRLIEQETARSTNEESLSHSSVRKVLRLLRLSLCPSLLQGDVVDAEGRGERNIRRVSELETDGLTLVGREAEGLLRVNPGGRFVLVTIGRKGLQEGAAGVTDLDIEEVVGRSRAFARTTVEPEG